MNQHATRFVVNRCLTEGAIGDRRETFWFDLVLTPLGDALIVLRDEAAAPVQVSDGRVNHDRPNQIKICMTETLMSFANAPAVKAEVMLAKVIWNVENP